MKRTDFRRRPCWRFGVTAAIAQSNVVEQRQDLMKEMGAQTRPIGGMMRGQEPFDLAKVQAGLKVFAENPKKFVDPLPRELEGRGEDRGSADHLGEQGQVRSRIGDEDEPGRPDGHGRRSRTRPPSRRKCRRCFRIAAPAITSSARRAPDLTTLRMGGLWAARFIWRSRRCVRRSSGWSRWSFSECSGFWRLTSPSAYRAHPRGSASGARRQSHAGSRERPHPVLRRRLHVVPCGAEPGRQAAARRRLCPEISLRHVPRSEHLAAQAGRHRLLDARRISSAPCARASSPGRRHSIRLFPIRPISA